VSVYSKHLIINMSHNIYKLFTRHGRCQVIALYALHELAHQSVAEATVFGGEGGERWVGEARDMIYIDDTSKRRAIFDTRQSECR